MRRINPKIPEGALKGIEKKIEHLKHDIERKLESLERVIVLGEDDKSTRLLAERAGELYGADARLRENIKDSTLRRSWKCSPRFMVRCSHGSWKSPFPYPLLWDNCT